MKRIESTIRARKWSEAERMLEELSNVSQEVGQAWFDVAAGYHSKKDWEAAIRANQRAAEYPMWRGTALYNLACAQSLAGHLDDAWSSLQNSVEAGFLDFDLMATDSDLSELRGVHATPMPKAHEFEEHRGRNGVVMPYLRFGPKGARDSERERPVLIALAPGGKRSGDWMAEEIWGELGDRTDWIVVIVAAPDRGWFTHPTHHALEDLLKQLQRDYKVQGERFHLFGIASGCRPATTYSRMSGKYFQTLTLVSSSAWGSYDDSDWNGWRDMSVLQLVGEDSFTLAADRAVHEQLKASRVHSTLTVIPGDGLLIPSLRGQDLLAAIEESLPIQND